MMLSLTRLLAIARKETIQLRRDPRSLLLAFAVPLFLLVFFGYAISFDVRDIRIAVLDDDGGQASHDLVTAFLASGYFQLTEYLDRYVEAEDLLIRRKATGVLVIPPDFSRNLAAGRRAPVQLILDGGDANSATIALGYADAIVAGYSSGVVLQGHALELPVRAEARVWYNPTLESRKMIVPGLIGVIMSTVAAMLTALTIAREWERGSMEQLVATPVRKLEVIGGKLLPYMVIGLLDVTLATIVGVALFRVPLHGSILLLGGMTVLFLLGALGLGIFISAALRSQVLATQIAMVVTYLPSLLLSGFIFDIASMPRVLQWFTYIVPARYFVTVTRGIFLKGVGLEALWVEALSMIAFALAGVGLATLSFQKRIAR